MPASHQEVNEIPHENLEYSSWSFFYSILQSQNSSSTSVPKSPVPTSVSTSPFYTEQNQLLPGSKKSSLYNDVDNLLIHNLQDTCRAEAWKTRLQQDEDDHFVHHVAGVMKCLPSRMKALACLQIEQVLMEIEFPPEPSTSHYSYPS